MSQKVKLALVSWVGAYIVITLALALLGPVMASWPLPLRTLLLSMLMVVAMTWLVMPSLTRLGRRWLSSAPSPHRAARSSAARERGKQLDRVAG